MITKFIPGQVYELLKDIWLYRYNKDVYNSDSTLAQSGSLITVVTETFLYRNSSRLPDGNLWGTGVLFGEKVYSMRYYGECKQRGREERILPARSYKEFSTMLQLKIPSSDESKQHDH